MKTQPQILTLDDDGNVIVATAEMLAEPRYLPNDEDNPEYIFRPIVREILEDTSW